MGEGGEGGSLDPDLVEPIFLHLVVNLSLPAALWGRHSKHLEGVREFILVTQATDLEEPEVLRRGGGRHCLVG